MAGNDIGQRVDYSEEDGRKIGTHLRVQRYLGPVQYKHHGVCLGRDLIVHFSDKTTWKSKALIRLTGFADFASPDETVEILKYDKTAMAGVHWTQVRQRGLILASCAEKSREGEPVEPADCDPYDPAVINSYLDYNLLTNNCETISGWIVTGRDMGSAQVRVRMIGPWGESISQWLAR